MSAVEAEVMELVSQQLGVPLSRISRTSSLQKDFGVDGDDAVDLIDAFKARFPADLQLLLLHWSRHFVPEGWSFADRRLNYAMFAGLGLAAAASAGLQPGLTFPLAVAIIAGTIILGVIAGAKAPPMMPITVGDLIEAAETGVWPLRYGDDPTRP